MGQRVPDFRLPDSEKKTRTLSEFLGTGGAIIAFFPFAFSGTSDKEMCTFRDDLSTFQSAGGRLVGISVDSVYALGAFARTYDLPFPLLSDFNKKVSKLYGVFQASWTGFGYSGVANSSVFVADRNGVLRYKWISDAHTSEPPYREVSKASQKLDV